MSKPTTKERAQNSREMPLGTGNVASHCCVLGYPCDRFILETARKLDYPFTILDLMERSARYKPNYLRNRLRMLRRAGKILLYYRSSMQTYILREWKQYYRRNSAGTNPEGVKTQHSSHVPPITFDFCSFLDCLEWEELCVHDLRVEFVTDRFDFVSNAWKYEKRSRCYHKRFEGKEFSFSVSCYDNGRVQVAVECSMKPLECTFSGIVKLACFLEDVRKIFGNNVPPVNLWVVTQWHYGRDSKREVSGASFNVTFSTWYEALARVYKKKELGKVRMEIVQSPKRKLADLAEEILLDKTRSIPQPLH